MASNIRCQAAAIAFLVMGIVTVANAQPQAVDVRALDQWRGRPVAKLEITGIPEALKADAVKGLALTPRRKLLRMRRAVLDPKVAEADAARLRLLMARHGFPNATVVGTGEANGDEMVNVLFEVRPGPAVVLGKLTLEGLPPASAAVADSVRAALAPGMPFDEDLIFEARDALMLSVRRAGHAEPIVDLLVVRPDSSSADLTFTCIPGPRFTYQRLILEGVPDDLVSLTERTIGLKPGTPYSPRFIQDTRRYLRDLDLFRQIRLKSVNRDSLADPSDDATLDLIADLRPRRMITLDASVGTFTDNPFVISASAAHRNIFGKGRGLSAGASYATHLRIVTLGTWWQALVVARSRTDLLASYVVEDEDSYQLDKFEVGLSTLFKPWVTTSFRLGISVSNGVLDNRSADEDAFASDVGLATVFSGMIYRDNTDSPLDPLVGHRLTFRGDWSPPGIFSDNPFASLRAYGSRYFPLGGRRVLAARLDGAVAWPLGDALDLVPDRRWFAGGVSTQRAYKRRRLGPVDSADQPIGGEVRILAGVEARLPIKGPIGIALFVDSGQVWRYTSDLSFGDYTVAGGLGLLFGTPVGPLRLDYAFNLTEPQRNEPSSVWHFAIGHPY